MSPCQEGRGLEKPPSQNVILRTGRSALGEVRLALSFEGLFRVRGVDGVVSQADGEVSPYRARGALPALGRPDHPPHGRDRVTALDDRADGHPAGEEPDELAKE